jgi:drug/metabolite transporter (DMT)-like permease
MSRSGLIWFSTTLLLFSSMEVVSKPLMASVDPFTLTFLRFAGGLAVLAPVSLLSGRGAAGVFRMDRGTLSSLAFLGFLNTFFSMSLLQLAVRSTGASSAAAVICSNPVFVLVFASIFGMERFSRGRLLGLLAGVTGIFLVASEGGDLKLEIGVVYAVVASIAFALYTVLGKRLVARVRPLAANTVSFFFGLLALAAFLLITGRPFSPGPGTDETSIVRIVYLGVGVSGLGYVAFFQTLKTFRATTASLIFYLKPVVAAILAALLLGETNGWAFAAGTLLIIGGSVLGGIRRRIPEGSGNPGSPPAGS